MLSPERLSTLGTGAFFLTGLLCGAWKYWHIRRSKDATSPEYVDIAHRAGLMYAFSCLVIRHFVKQSALNDEIERACVLALLVYFTMAQFSYIVHGLLRDTDNQLRRPHRLGGLKIPSLWMTIFMRSLIAVEIGAFAVLFWGALVQ